MIEKQIADLKKKLADEPGHYHMLFILDEPGMNGLQLAKKLKEDKLTDSISDFYDQFQS